MADLVDFGGISRLPRVIGNLAAFVVCGGRPVNAPFELTEREDIDRALGV